MDRPKIVVTNDDGVDSTGLHVLVRHLTEIGDVTVIAPNEEYSGYSAAFGPLYKIQPEVHRGNIDGVENTWIVSGPPAQCIMFMRLGAFDITPDIVVSGINPGANVGRAVYHSGTIGACLTARLGGIPSVAISQSVTGFGVDGQAWEDALENQLWDSAAEVATRATEAMLADPPPDAGVLNLNVPNSPIDKIDGWEWTTIAATPPRTMSVAKLEPKLGHESAYNVRLEWGDQQPQPEGSDTWAVFENKVAASWLSRIDALDLDTPGVANALTTLVGK